MSVTQIPANIVQIQNIYTVARGKLSGLYRKRIQAVESALRKQDERKIQEILAKLGMI